MECPECKKPMKWQEGLLSDSGRDMSVGRHYCSVCNLFMKQTESRGIRKGKNLAESLKGVPTMDRKITRYSAAVQIGILRARQHCKTCGKPNYPKTKVTDWCRCEKCNCLYCQDKIPAKESESFLKLQQEEVERQIRQSAPHTGESTLVNNTQSTGDR